jgi:hypothetical protein
VQLFGLNMIKISRMWHVIGIFALLALLSTQQAATQPVPAISILSPGEGSAVTAPIALQAELKGEDIHYVRLALTERYGRKLSRQLHRLNPAGDSSFEFYASLPFEAPNQSTRALLSLATYDQYYRPIAMRSVNLTLLKDGTARIVSSPVGDAWLEIREPQPEAVLTGGQVRVSGVVTPVTDRNVFLDLVNDSGRVIGTGQLAVDAIGETIEFEISIPYVAITTKSDVRLVVRQTSGIYGVNVILDSVTLTLEP